MSRLQDLEAEEQFRRKPLWWRILVLALYGLIVGGLMYLGATYAEESGENPGNYRN